MGVQADMYGDIAVLPVREQVKWTSIATVLRTGMRSGAVGSNLVYWVSNELSDARIVDVGPGTYRSPWI